ncbi:MAG: hypothetical protein JW751_20225 [Polyangiaceae bacterium]|nr:hypothetical protein [Polyangiaceae bacterium]
MRRSFRWVGLGLLGLDACSRPATTVDSPPRAAAPNSLARPAPSANSADPETTKEEPESADAPAGGEPHPCPPAMPIPAAPPGIDQKWMEYLGSICAVGQMTLSDGTTLVGCRDHAPHDVPGKWPDGAILEVDETATVFAALSSVYEGSFTRPGAKEIVLAFDSPFMVDSHITQSVVVIAPHGARWRAVAYRVDESAVGFATLRRSDGVDLLVGHDEFGGLHDGVVSWFYAIDFTTQPKQHDRCFARIPFNAFDIPCTFQPDPTELPPFSDDSIVSIEIASTRAEDLDGDGQAEFIVQVRYARQQNTLQFLDRVRAWCKTQQYVLTSQYLPAPASHTLVFELKGQRFLPTTRTRKLLDSWRTTWPIRWEQYTPCPEP